LFCNDTPLNLSSPVAPLSTKSGLRSALKASLGSIPRVEHSSHARLVAEHLINSDVYRSVRTIYAYASLLTELSLDPFMATALADGKRICIPAIDWDTKSMIPAQIQNLDTDLESGRYGVRTPVPSCPLVEPNDIDLILIPGLAFDHDLNRLGRGAGFYDRMIDSMSTSSTRPPLVGVCFDCQIVERVPTEPHDHPMDRVITQTGFIDSATEHM